MTAPTFHPAPHPTEPSAALTTLMAVPRRSAAHRRQPPGGRCRAVAVVAAWVLVGLTLLLGLVGWVALVAVVLG